MEHIGWWLCGTRLCSNPVTCYTSGRGDILLQPAQRWKALGEMIRCDRQMILKIQCHKKNAISSPKKKVNKISVITKRYLHHLVPLTPLQFGQKIRAAKLFMLRIPQYPCLRLKYKERENKCLETWSLQSNGSPGTRSPEGPIFPILILNPLLGSPGKSNLKLHSLPCTGGQQRSPSV